VNPLEQWPFSAVRRNHALEHATITMLSRRNPSLRLVGRSDWGGFTLYGPVSSDDVRAAVDTALQRLQGGEAGLAVHPRCGTNFATGFVLAGLASYAALSSKRRSILQRVVQLVLGLTAASILARPLGETLQEHVTTSLDVARLRVADIRRLQRGDVVIHRIETTQE
jgi:hypothetical protein